MASSVQTAGEKRYDPEDSSLTVVDRQDDLDFVRKGFASPRALMSCGHAVTPTSLTNWCRRLLDQGKTKFVCGQTGCDVEWPYDEVRKMALLTPEELQYFEKAMSTNASGREFPTTSCPKCKSPVVRRRRANLRVRCTLCPANDGENFRFCWQCRRRWRGPAPRSDRCANYGCCNELVKTLQTCPDAVFESVRGVTGCPSMRACPTCGMLLQHDKMGCKNVRCPRCRMKFCFVCLKRTRLCWTTSDYFLPCSSGVAPRQMSIPVWRKKKTIIKGW